MASFSKKSIRSISFPRTLHPTTIKLEEELNKLRASSNEDIICENLCGLVELYKCMDELLNMPQTIQALSKYQSEQWVDELFKGSLKLIDICVISRDVASLVMENVRDLQSSLRRRNSESGIEASISKYTTFRKKMKKDVKKSIATLKQMDHQAIESSILDVDQHVSDVIRELREVNTISISIFQSMMRFLSASKKQSKWSISRLMNKGHDQQENELESTDTALCSLCGAEEVQSVQTKLRNIETQFQSIETDFEDMFRCLIRSRTFLLNIFSC